MIIILIMTVVFLFITIASLCFDFFKQKKSFETRIEVLENLIDKLHKQQKIHLDKLQLSETLDKQIKLSNHTLSASILDIGTDLFSSSFNKKE